MEKTKTTKSAGLFLLSFLFIAGIFAGTVVSEPLLAQESPTADAVTVTATTLSVKSVKLPNFSQVTTGMYRGGRPLDEDGFQQLKDIGIKTVIDLQGGDIGNSDFGWIAGMLEPGEHPEWIKFEREGIEALGMTFVNVPINSLDQLNQKTGKALGRALALAADPANQPVYIHCEHGVDRTGLAVALYRVYFQKWLKQEAYDEMVEMGHGFFRRIFTGGMSDFFWAATQGMP